MKFRQQCGGFEDSMKGVFEVKDMQDLTNTLRFLGHTGEIVVNPHGYYDGRNGWDTHTVTVDGDCIGFTDGVYSCLGCGTDGHARSCVLYNERKQKENTKSGYSPSGRSPNPTPSKPVCLCKDWIPVRGTAVTFDCPVHGRVTIDCRIASVNLNTPPAPPAPYTPGQIVPYTPPFGLMWHAPHWSGGLPCESGGQSQMYDYKDEDQSGTDRT